MWRFHTTAVLVVCLLMPSLLEATPATSQPSAIVSELGAKDSISTAGSTDQENGDSCAQHRERSINDKEEEIRCCNSTYSNFRKNWQTEGSYLTELLATLESWNCSQFKSECQNPSFNFNYFTDLVYDSACNQTGFRQRCYEHVAAVATKRKLELVDWNSIVQSLVTMKLQDDELMSTCIQVALYKSVSKASGSIHGYYHEVKRAFLPFCGIVWCGIDAQNMHDHWISSWMCISYHCRTNLIVVMVVCSILSVICFLENVAVVAVYAKNKELRDSQGCFKLSLGFVDLIAAGIIFPTFANSLSKVTTSREVMGLPYNTSAVVPANQRFDSIPHLPGGDAWSHFDQPYLNFVGFFTTIYLAVTIFTLVMASVDRNLFYYRYRFFSKSDAKKFALIAIPTTWIAGVVLAIPSFFVNNYSLIASIMVLSSGPTALLYYVIVYAIPIVAMWILSLAALILRLKKASRFRNAMDDSNGTTQDFAREHHQSRSLNIMVGTFTLSLILGSVSAIASWVAVDEENSNQIDDQALNTKASLEFVSIMFLISNSFWNFFVHFLSDKKFRKGVRNLFACACCDTQIAREPGMTSMESTTADEETKSEKSVNESTTRM